MKSLLPWCFTFTILARPVPLSLYVAYRGELLTIVIVDRAEEFSIPGLKPG